MQTGASEARISDLQVLRAVAVLAVAVTHLRGFLLPGDLPFFGRLHAYFSGSPGVDLFMVISGFIIARRLIPEIIGAQPGAFWPVVAHFWARRAVRLLPAAWCWLALTLALAIGFNASGAFGAFSANLSWAVKAVLLAANFQYVGVPDPSALGALSHYWSLSLEEQFYLALPFVLLAAAARPATVLVGLVLLQCLPLPGLELYWVPFRFTPLLLGVLLGLGQVRGGLAHLAPTFLAARRGWGFLALLLGSGCLVTLLGSSLQFVSAREANFLAAWCSLLLVWLASYDLKLFSVQPWVDRLLVGLGDRSYALYLCHMPTYCLCRELLHRFGGDLAPRSEAHVATALVLAVALLAAFTELTHRLIERRWQRAWAPGLAELGARKQAALRPSAGG
ncbi:MAG: acyltransferase [Candidatus Sericytochromatia bacterium]|nr:acyltransferase [Candidatus Sericytochromatia bacterium]